MTYHEMIEGIKETRIWIKTASQEETISFLTICQEHDFRWNSNDKALEYRFYVDRQGDAFCGNGNHSNPRFLFGHEGSG